MTSPASGEACSYVGADTDGYAGAGDIDGEGRAEVLLLDASEGGPNHAALLRWDTASDAFTLSWEVTGTIPGLLP